MVRKINIQQTLDVLSSKIIAKKLSKGLSRG